MKSFAPNDKAEERITAYLRGIGITAPVRDFVHQVSNAYHMLESSSYDSVHAEFTETEGVWRKCLDRLEPLLPESIRVLDLGAGTGFASAQVLRWLGGKVSSLTCQDLSPEMLETCERKLQSLADGRGIELRFRAGLHESLVASRETYDLILTNSVLHHLLGLRTFFDSVRILLKPGGVYVAGHEPCAEFYGNASLYRWTKVYRQWRRIRRLFHSETYLRRIKLAPEMKGIEERTNDELVRSGAISSALPPGVVRQLVDIHVPPASEHTPFWGEPGFSPNGLRETYFPEAEVVFLETYHHIKDARVHMGAVWRRIDAFLARKYPHCGANFIVALRMPRD
jgi:SAM-dependent methyltransferase